MRSKQQQSHAVVVVLVTVAVLVAITSLVMVTGQTTNSSSATNGTASSASGGTHHAHKHKKRHDSPIDDLVTRLLRGGTPDEVNMDSTTGSPITLANRNRITTEGNDADEVSRELQRESSKKKFLETGAKRDEEERNKIRTEEYTKQARIKRESLRNEQHAKSYEARMHMTNENAVKKGRQYMSNQLQIARKEIQGAQQGIELAQARADNERKIENQRLKLAESTAKKAEELREKKSSEELSKISKRSKNKVSEMNAKASGNQHIFERKLTAKRHQTEQDLKNKNRRFIEEQTKRLENVKIQIRKQYKVKV